MYVRSQTAWFDRGYAVMAVSNGARRHSLFKTYHGREMAAGAMLSEETSPPVCFLLKPEAGVMPRFDSQNPHPRDWRILYRVAIFERDSRVIEKRLSDAEDAIVGVRANSIRRPELLLKQREAFWTTPTMLLKR
jgi:hypothetical protein